MSSRAKVKRQDRIDAEASPNVSMQRLASSLEREQRSQQLSRILIFLFVLTWLSLLFGRSLMRQGRILDQVYENAAKDNRIQQLRMSNAQLQEEIYSRTDLQAIAQAAVELGMIPSLEAPRILVPQTKNDEVLLRLESADAESFVERVLGGRETYYNLEEYYEEHRLAQAYFSNFDPANNDALEEFVTSSQAVTEDGGIILDGGASDTTGDASIVKDETEANVTEGHREADSNESAVSETHAVSTTVRETTGSLTTNARTTIEGSNNSNTDELAQDNPSTNEPSLAEDLNEVVNE